MKSPVLDKSYGCRFLAEALSAKIKSVLANETSLVSTETALTAAFAIFSGARKPNSVVGHFVGDTLYAGLDYCCMFVLCPT